MNTFYAILGLALLFVGFVLVGRLSSRSTGCGACSDHKPECDACPPPDRNSESKHVSS